ISVLASLDARGDVALVDPFASEAASQAFIGATVRCQLGDWSLIGGPELPLSSAAGSPQYRVVVGVEWSPRDIDSDRDGVMDGEDACPEHAEDLDGVADHDGCPDPDIDADGVNDDVDRCVRRSTRDDVAGFAEDRDGFEDEDGCPDPDNDGDGVPDTDDKCPNQAGVDAPQHTGCPVVDQDGDGMNDATDQCPTQPEDVDGFEDEDGCPDP